ncbi:CP12 domain-containing protein [Pantanalinema rosaneae CENA516]
MGGSMQTIDTPLVNKSSLPLTLDQRIATAIAEARAICSEYGSDSAKCAVAWDIVEELQAEAAHQKVTQQGKTAFTEYCEEFPDALEARIYDV